MKSQPPSQVPESYRRRQALIRRMISEGLSLHEIEASLDWLEFEAACRPRVSDQPETTSGGLAVE